MKSVPGVWIVIDAFLKQMTESGRMMGRNMSYFSYLTVAFDRCPVLGTYAMFRKVVMRSAEVARCVQDGVDVRGHQGTGNIRVGLFFQHQPGNTTKITEDARTNMQVAAKSVRCVFTSKTIIHRSIKDSRTRR